MILVPDNIRAQLLANGANRDANHMPVLKLFNPLGPALWLASELDADGDTLFGLADLGFGCPELGSFSLSEIASIRLPFSMGIERDIAFVGRFALSVYAEAARSTGQITEAEALLNTIASARTLWPEGGQR